MKPYTVADLEVFLLEFVTGKYPHQRMGQAFCNKFLDGSESNPELFYNKNDAAVRVRIRQMQDEIQNAEPEVENPNPNDPSGT